MDFLEKLLKCNENDVDHLVDERLEELSNTSDKKDYLGFTPGLRSLSTPHKGFIPFYTRIRFAMSSTLDYSMDTRDFYYTFAHLVKHYNFENIRNVIVFLMTFINDYFGVSFDRDRREDIQEELLRSTVTDEEYFNAVENLKIGYFKGKRLAKCTERSALAQNILSMFGVEIYYCMGVIDKEAHCFNVIRDDISYYILDYNQFCSCKNGKRSYYIPLLNKIPDEVLTDFFINNKGVKVEVYDFIDGKKKKNGDKEYIIGKWDFDKTK